MNDQNVLNTLLVVFGPLVTAAATYWFSRRKFRASAYAAEINNTKELIVQWKGIADQHKKELDESNTAKAEMKAHLEQIIIQNQKIIAQNVSLTEQYSQLRGQYEELTKQHESISHQLTELDREYKRLARRYAELKETKK